MASTDDPKTLGRARLSFASAREIDEFAATLARFERGEIGPDQWRAFRLVHGTYGQRQDDDRSMVRAKIPQGILDAAQIRALADVADQYSRGFCHVTTRQNVQFHFVRLQDVEHAMRRLAEAGLTTREACGNSVRTITGCPWAGVAADEPFDVTPYAEAMTRHFLRHPLAAALPRKFKMAFEGCAHDHVATGINDLGWRARLGPNGQPGFRVTVGGGTSTMPTAGAVLFEWLPAGEILQVAEAVVRVFDRLGDRVHRKRNRLKFLVRTMGWEPWRAAFDATLAEVRREEGHPLPFDPAHPPVEQAPTAVRPSPLAPAAIAAAVAAGEVRGPGVVPDVRPIRPAPTADVARWRATNVRPQRQSGYTVVTVRLPLGDCTAAQWRVVAALAEAYGDGTVRTTLAQNVMLRWVPIDAIDALHARLAAAGLALPDADTAADVTSCPGAESCRLAVTHSRGLGRLLTGYLDDRPGLVAAAGPLGIKISGCPNGCGQHHVADIGFQGAVRKHGTDLLPQYFVLVGGSADGTARFGRLAAKVPVRRIPEVVERIFGLYARERHGEETAAAFLARIDTDRVRALLADLEQVEPGSLSPEDATDLGETVTPATTTGECSA